MLLGENSDYIEDMFGAAVQYQVPRYQRRYVWDKGNWSTLWEDILSQLYLRPAAIQPDNKSNMEPENESRAHFTGLIVTRPISKGKLARFEVIDGQQRLTTFQIILSVTRDMCELKGHDELADEVDGHIANTGTVVRRNISEIFPDPTYKFRPTDYDESAFQAIVQGKYGKAIPAAFDEEANLLQPKLIDQIRSNVFGEPKDVGRNILDAYDYFYERIRIYVGETCEYDKIDNLISSIKSGFNLIHITLNSSDQPEEIFESLNATGRKLSEFDYLRNHLFLRAGKLGLDQESGRFYSDIFYDKYWHFENASHYWDADQLESFLRAFLIAELGPENEGKILNSFDRYRDYSKTLTQKQKQSVKYEFEQLKRYADSYQEISDPNSEIGRRMQFYDDLHISRLDAFILFLKHRLKLDSCKLLSVCDILESYIVRRMLCPNGQDSYRTINQIFFKTIEIGKTEFSLRNFAEDLSSTWPGFEAEEALKQTWSKDVNLILYILYRIELCKREAAGREFRWLNFRDLEMPSRLVFQCMDDFYAADSIGNITPLREDLDEDLRSFSFKDQKTFLREFAPDLILTEEICSWTTDTISTAEICGRTEDLLCHFSKIWKHAVDYL